MADAISPLRVSKRGTTIATGAASVNAAIPTDSSGNAPRYVRVTATVAAYVSPGKGPQTAAAGDVMVQPGDSIILNVTGCDNIAAIQVAAAGVVQISTLENG